jgi:hypothetical protein
MRPPQLDDPDTRNRSCERAMAERLAGHSDGAPVPTRENELAERANPVALTASLRWTSATIEHQMRGPLGSGC